MHFFLEKGHFFTIISIYGADKKNGYDWKSEKKDQNKNNAHLGRVYRAIRMLKQPERRIIELFFGDHNHPAKSIREIAQEMGMDVKKVWEIKELGFKNLISICHKLRKHE